MDQLPRPAEEHFTGEPALCTINTGSRTMIEFSEESEVPIIAVTDASDRFEMLDSDQLRSELRECPDFADMCTFLANGVLPENEKTAGKIVYESDYYTYENDILYHLYSLITKKYPDGMRGGRQT